MDVIEDRFAEGLRVLVVDDNLTCLRILEMLLQRCKYEVTRTQDATEALRMLMENPKKYDIVISDVHMPIMDGFQLLENIGLHMDIPVIMLSADDDYTQVMKGIKHGAVDYLIKPLRTEELKNIWQHVVRRKRQDTKKGKTIAAEKEGGDDQFNDGRRITSQEPEAEPETQKRKDTNDDGDDKDGSKTDNYIPSGSKKQRVIWYPSLHKKFVNAVDQLGLDKAFPKKILDIMNVEGLTREKVASHLQKYRLYLRKMKHTMEMGQSAYPSLFPFGSHNSSLFPSGGPMFNPCAPVKTLESSLPNSSIGLKVSFHPNTTNGVVLDHVTTPTNYPRGYIARIPCTNQFQINSNQVTTSGPSTRGVEGLPNQLLLPAQHSEYRPQSGNPNVRDQTKCMENCQNNTDQVPPTNFNGGVYSTEISHSQNLFENTLIDVPGTSRSQYPFPPVVQSRGFNTVELQEHGGDSVNLVNTSNNSGHPNQWFGESSSNPYGAFANPTCGHVVEINTSSGIQNIEAQTREADALLNLDVEDYLLDEPDSFVGFHENDDVFLMEDIVNKLLD